MRYPQHKPPFGRIPSKGLISGVCAGIAARFKMSTFGVRILYCACLFVTGFFPLLALYLILTIALPVREKDTGEFHDETENQDHRSETETHRKRKQLKSLFTSNEKRLNKLESWIISSEYEWERKYRGL